MKREERSTNQTVSTVLETFGGDYHRLESDFQPKREAIPTAKSRREKRTKPSKDKRSRTG